ncbi:Methyltransferase domain-containing protein [Neorhodopirellula lusitana]|uniref:Methyltransferase domain-containing protein n=1 Tax=Neorhodopirellula lusitana TaxID=445327 RepID=A0ABY1PWV9_9BACT|nr:class I SAM-dependent methyltransferase [Neorhodopirellula lusitana]SMP51642.1 Methyltransferase domain-containing protein [Neorhodopirellula lusitana]
MLPRVCEPTPDDPQADADAYLAMDNDAVNRQFVADLLASPNEAPAVGPLVIDLGCGPALIPIRLCEMYDQLPSAKPLPYLHVMGIDCCVEMLDLARFELEMAGRVDQIELQQIDLSDPEGLHTEIADTIICNTVLHHLETPANAIDLAIRALKPGGRLFVRDLVRPATPEDVEELVAKHTGQDPTAAVPDAPLSPAQLLRQSLRAALTLDEIRETVSQFDIPSHCVEMTSDRHWTLDWQKPKDE